MLQIISRDDWGARAPRRRVYTTWSQRSEFIVHHSAGPIGQTPASVQAFHMDGRGWDDVGYNFLIDHRGRIYGGRGWLVIGAHASGHNTSGLGVCVIGRDGPDITAAALLSVRWLYEEACRRGGHTLTARTHGDVNATDCPGDVLRSWVHAGMPVDGQEGDDLVIGLAIGATGERVKALQTLIVYAGLGAALEPYGIDGAYGPATAEALRLVRASVGSKAAPGYGDTVTGRAYGQLIAAVAREQGK